MDNELNKFMALNVMKWTLKNFGGNNEAWMVPADIDIFPEGNKWEIKCSCDDWNPAGNISHAMEVVDKLKGEYCFELYPSSGSVNVYQNNDVLVPVVMETRDNGLSLAICLAAKKVVEGE